MEILKFTIEPSEFHKIKIEERAFLTVLGNLVNEITCCNLEITNGITDNRSYAVDNWKFRETRFGFKYCLKDGIEEVYKNDDSFFYDKPKYSNVKLMNYLKNNSY